MSAISFLLCLYSWSLQPGWVISSSGSNFVTKWLHLSSSEMCRGNQGTAMKRDVFEKGKHYSKISLWFPNSYLCLLLATLMALVDSSCTFVRKLLLLSVLTKLMRLECLTSKRSKASSLTEPSLPLDAAGSPPPPPPGDTAVSRVSMCRMCPLWV